MSLPVVGFVILVDVLDDQNAAYPAVQNFIELYINETREILIFGPSESDIDREGVKVIPLPRDAPGNTVFRILSYIWYQCRLAVKLFQVRNHCDSMFFHIGGTAMLLPVVACQLGKPSINIFVLASLRTIYQQNHSRSVTSRIVTQQLVALEWLTTRLADRILVLSEGMVSPSDGQFSTAERVASNLNYIDCDRFERGPPVSERPYDIVYIGRFEQEKGIVKLANALTRLAERRPEVRVKLIGDGSLYDEVKEILQGGNATEQVDLTGWVDHEEIPTHLAESQLLVLPSESEGVPKTILEALACGTIPVATPVGGVPDIVSDKTGVLLTDNNPETIARVLDRTLNRDDLNEMASRGRAYIRSTHSFEATAERFRAFLASDVNTDSST